MSKKVKPQKVTLKSIFRLFILIIFIYIIINFINQQKKQNSIKIDPTSYIGENNISNFFLNIYQKLPQDSKYQIEHFSETNFVKFLTNKTNLIKNQLDGFPQKQIKQIKKDIIKSISDDMIKNIDQN